MATMRSNPRVKRLNSAFWWPTPHCSRRSRSIPERFPIDSASLARQTQFGPTYPAENRWDSRRFRSVRACEVCCRALKLPTMPSLSMHTKHGVVRRRDDGVLDMVVPHPRGNGGHWHTGSSPGRSRSQEIAVRWAIA